MAHPNFPAPNTGGNVQIAGQGIRGQTGKLVFAGQAFADSFAELKKAADGNNYWALQVVLAIQSLSSSELKPNIHVAPECMGQMDLYTIKVPGCLAKVLKRNNGTFVLSYFSFQGDFLQRQMQGVEPGLHEVVIPGSIHKQEPKTKFLGAGVLPHNNCQVVVTDRYPTLKKAAVESYIALLPFNQFLQQQQFWMFFTPGDEPYGGAKSLEKYEESRSAQYNPDLDITAMQLYKTMIDNRKLDYIVWVPECGGVGVQTRALQMLLDKNESFHDQKHSIYFCNPTTDAEVAIKLAEKLGFNFLRHTHNISYSNLNELAGSGALLFQDLRSSYRRFKNQEEYKITNFMTDVYSQTSSKMGVTSGVVDGLSKLAACAGSIMAYNGLATGDTETAVTGGVIAAVFGFGKATCKGAWAYLNNHHRGLAAKIKRYF